MEFSYGATWDDTVRMFRAHASLIAAIAGVFIFLPAVLISYFQPPPEEQGAQLLQHMVDYFRSNLHWFILQRLIQMIGAIAILLLLFGRGQITVGAAIVSGMVLLPSYFAASALSGITIGIGLFLLIVPGLYLVGRLLLASVVVAAENQWNPITAIQRSLAITKGRGWASVGLVLLVAIAGIICVMAITSVLGILLLLVAGTLGKLLLLILSAALSSMLSVLLLLLSAAIYRQLTADSSRDVFN